jgi:hypothetical protein
MVFVNSGYSRFGGLPDNGLLGFEPGPFFSTLKARQRPG